MDGSDTKASEEAQASRQVKPGDTVAPGDGAPKEPTSQDADTPAPAEDPGNDEQAPEDPEVQTPQPRMQSDDSSISWTASEFVAHHKSPGWYGAVLGCAVVAAAVVYLLTRDKISTAVVLVGAIVFAAYASRPPRQIQYRLDMAGLTVSEKYYDLNNFRSFFVVREGAFSNITFLPLKRFAPLLTVYYDPADEEKILGLLGASLPMERRGPDAIDSFMKKIRF